MTTRFHLPLLAALVLCLPRAVFGADTVTHAYDFEAAENFATEPGWIHIDPTVRATDTEPGIVVPEAEKITAVERGETPLAPPDLLRDYLSGGAALMNSDDEPAFVFRDIVPANATGASITVFRTDAADIYAPKFRTRVSLPDGSTTEIDAGSEAFAKEHEPIVAEISLGTAPYLDIAFVPAPGSTGSSVRINGVSITYTVSSGSGSTGKDRR